MRSVFGKNLKLFMILIVLLCALLGLVYQQFEPVRDFVDGLGIFPTTTNFTPTPPIDPNGEQMAVHYIDVGQGDATLFQTALGSVLVDVGEKEYGDDVVEYLKSQGVTELEYLFITHPDSDHMGCAAYVMQNIKVKRIVMNGQEKSAVFFEKALDEIEKQDIEAIIAAPGDVFKVGALTLTVYGPQRIDFSEAKWNNASLIIKAQYNLRSFLLTGDAEEDGEADLLNRYGVSALKCDVFQAGHHGSRTSNSLALLQTASPQFVVVSSGAGNSYGHPHEEALANFAKVGATVLRTDERGTIVFITDGEELYIK